MSDDKHRCPGPGCVEQMPRHLLACRYHWSQVSPSVKARVNREWRAGRSGEYFRARDDAIKEMRPQ